jgi:hypothetical protein
MAAAITLAASNMVADIILSVTAALQRRGLRLVASWWA